MHLPQVLWKELGALAGKARVELALLPTFTSVSFLNEAIPEAGVWRGYVDGVVMSYVTDALSAVRTCSSSGLLLLYVSVIYLASAAHYHHFSSGLQQPGFLCLTKPARAAIEELSSDFITIKSGERKGAGGCGRGE